VRLLICAFLALSLLVQSSLYAENRELKLELVFVEGEMPSGLLQVLNKIIAIESVRVNAIDEESESEIEGEVANKQADKDIQEAIETAISIIRADHDLSSAQVVEAEFVLDFVEDIFQRVFNTVGVEGELQPLFEQSQKMLASLRKFIYAHLVLELVTIVYLSLSRVESQVHRIGQGDREHFFPHSSKMLLANFDSFMDSFVLWDAKYRRIYSEDSGLPKLEMLSALLADVFVYFDSIKLVKNTTAHVTLVSCGPKAFYNGRIGGWCERGEEGHVPKRYGVLSFIFFASYFFTKESGVLFLGAGFFSLAGMNYLRKFLRDQKRRTFASDFLSRLLRKKGLSLDCENFFLGN